MSVFWFCIFLWVVRLGLEELFNGWIFLELGGDRVPDTKSFRYPPFRNIQRIWKHKNFQGFQSVFRLFRTSKKRPTGRDERGGFPSARWHVAWTVIVQFTTEIYWYVTVVFHSCSILWGFLCVSYAYM